MISSATSIQGWRSLPTLPDDDALVDLHLFSCGTIRADEFTEWGQLYDGLNPNATGAVICVLSTTLNRVQGPRSGSSPESG
jgi:hypothetical protein